MQLICRDQQIRTWFGQRNPIEAIRRINGQVVRSKEGRTTQRFEIDGQGLYAKLHEGIGWPEVIKNLLQLRLPITGASNEWHAINLLHKLGVDTLDAVAFGQHGSNPARKQSFIITRELTHTSKLAQFCQSWTPNNPNPRLKWQLIRKVSDIARTLHGHGLNHRDFYLCHFLLDIRDGIEHLDPDHLRIFVVDLHRAQIRAKVPQRWLVKDIASIYFSAMDLHLTRRDLYRFIKTYTGLPLRQALDSRKSFWQKVRRRARQLYIRDWKRPPKEVI